MEKTRNQKYACLLLAVIVMISGICLERVPADAFFSCTKNSTITRSDSTYKDLSLCRTETLNQREVLNSLCLAKREGRRGQARAAAALYFSNADILPHIFQSNQGKGEETQGYEILCSLVVLTYIHNQDGEKA